MQSFARSLSSVSIRIAFLACAAFLFLPACSHYRLGTGGKLPFRSLYIAPVENTANVPQGAALFSAQLREAFVRDGRVTLAASPDAADAVLSVNLENYSRRMTTSRGDDTGLARKFDLTIAAVCTLKDARAHSAAGGADAGDGAGREGAGEKIYFEKRPVSATKQIFTTPTPDATTSDQLQAEYNTLPLLATSLAESVAHAVLDVW